MHAQPTHAQPTHAHIQTKLQTKAITQQEIRHMKAGLKITQGSLKHLHTSVAG